MITHQWARTAACGCALLGSAYALAQRPYGVEDLLQTEEIGRVELDNAGRFVLLERRAPFRSEGRSRVQILDLGTAGEPTPLIETGKASESRLGPLSPDGERAFVLLGAAESLRPAIMEIKTRRILELETTPAAGSLHDAVWFDDGRLIFRTARTSFSEALTDGQLLMEETWARMRAGSQPTASEVGSGAYLRRAVFADGSGLVMVDLRNTATKALASGNFISKPLPSPDGRWIAALRGLPSAAVSTGPLDHFADGMIKKELIVLSVDGKSAEQVPCPECIVAPGTLRWSEDGDALLFFARRESASWETGRFWIYQPAHRDALPWEIRDIVAEIGPKSFAGPQPRSGWVGKNPAIYGYRAGALDHAGGKSPAAQWYLAVRHKSQIAVAPLTTSFSAETRPPPELQPPTAHSKLLSADKQGRWAIFTDDAGGETRVFLVRATHGSREILRINPHLAAVAGGKPVRVEYTDAFFGKLSSWILLPPNKTSAAHPAVVVIYPGAVGGQEWTGWRLSDPQTLNTHLLAAHGYAVVYPSLPWGPDQHGRRRDDLVRMIESAVDAAATAGYVDPARLAILGHSFGAYGVLCTVSRTNRFKAAVALAGVYNLLSNYGTFNTRQRMAARWEGTDLAHASWSEGGQARLGTPPWKDPLLYLRNSPLFDVERIETPLLLIHGDRDFVPMTQSEEMFTALRRLNKDAVFVRYWGESHLLESPANVRDLWSRLFSWIDRRLAVEVAGAVPKG